MSKAEQIIADFETQKTTYEQERELRMQELEEKREELEIETNYWRDL
jgi:hypothetical protein